MNQSAVAPVAGREPTNAREQAGATGVAALPRDRRSGPPHIFLAATLRWPLAARLAIAFRALGCPVQAWCPAGHPLEKTRAVERIHRASVLAPLWSLRDALHAAVPDFVIPCDDDAAIHLHRLHERSGDDPAAAVRRLIERSLGTPASCSRASARSELMDLALAEGVRVPAPGRLASASDLENWCAHHGFPAVLKVDRSWGGLGVTVVGDLAQARRAFRAATHPSLLRALSHLILRRDSSFLWRQLGGVRPAVTVQRFISGRAANRAVACWRGEVLAGISVVALQTQTVTGPATVVQVIENPEMSDAACRLVRALGLTGFCGLDFVIEESTGAAHLIEVNPRATPIGHLALGAGHDLPAALHARLLGASVPLTKPAIPGDVIAMFPGEWRRDPLSHYMRDAFHDVPWEEIGLVRDCVELPWEERGFAARLRARLSPGRRPAAALFPPREMAAARDAPRPPPVSR